MKRKFIGRIEVAQMQVTLRKTLNLLDGDTKDLLFFFLYKEHGVSVYDPDNLSKKKIGSAFSALFGKGADVLMEKFDAEMKSA